MIKPNVSSCPFCRMRLVWESENPAKSINSTCFRYGINTENYTWDYSWKTTITGLKF